MLSTYHVNVMREDPSSLEVSQGTGGILWFVMCQETVVEKCAVTSDRKLIGMLVVYATDHVELSAREHGVIAAPFLRIEHLFV